MVIYRQIGISLICGHLGDVNVDMLSEVLGMPRADLPQALLDTKVDETRVPLVGAEYLGGSLQVGTEYHAVRYVAEDGCKWCVQVARLDPSIVKTDRERWLVSVGPLVHPFNTTIANDSSRWEPLLERLSKVGLKVHCGPAIGPDVALICGIVSSCRKEGYSIQSLSDYLWPVQVDRCGNFSGSNSYWSRSLGAYCFQSFYEPRHYYGWLAEGIIPKNFGMMQKKWVGDFPCYRGR